MKSKIIVGQVYDCTDHQQRKVLEVGKGVYRFDPHENYVSYEIIGKPGLWFKRFANFLLIISK